MSYITEEWKPVVGFEQYYQVSNLGAVRRSVDGQRRGIKAGFVLKPHVNKKGYLFVGLYDRDAGTMHSKLVHNLVTAAFFGAKPPGMQVNHIDGDKTNPSAVNLEYVTPSANQCHANRTGLRFKKLKPEQIPEIRKLDGTMSYGQIGKRFNISDETARCICKRLYWAHID